MKKIKKIIDFFELKDEANFDSKNESLILYKIKSFICNFKNQTIKYKIVWIIRILCWLSFILVGIIGTFF